MQITLKVEYESTLGPHVSPFVDAKKIPHKGDLLDIGGVMAEVQAVMKTPFSKLQAAIVCVREAPSFFR